MKKNILKSAKSIIFAVALCAVAALGAFSAATTANSPEVAITASHPGFIIGGY